MQRGKINLDIFIMVILDANMFMLSRGENHSFGTTKRMFVGYR
jgi:hypothetical protein